MRRSRCPELRPPRFQSHHLSDVADGLLAVADDEEVDEVGQRLGVERAVNRRGDERVLGTPRGRPHRHAGQVDAVQHVRVDQLGRQVEAMMSKSAAGRCVSTLKEGNAPAPA